MTRNILSGAHAPDSFTAPLALYVRSMGKALRVTGAFLTDDEANAWIAARERRGERHGVVACAGPLVLTAALDDSGVRIDDPARRA